MTIAVELARAIDGPDVMAALTARGLDSELAADGLGLLVQADDATTVSLFLDSWASERGLPFVPIRVDGTSFALAPPAG